MLKPNWTLGDVSASQTLSDLPSPNGDHLYAGHINEIRETFNNLKNVFSLIEYGAVGDGSTDDTVAIQAAVDAWTAKGGVLFAPITDNFYKITDTIIVNTSLAESIALMFSGLGGRAKFVMTGVANKPVFHFNTSGVDVVNPLFLVDLLVQSDSTNYDGFLIDHWFIPTIYHCRAFYCGQHGINLRYSCAPVIEKCQFDHNQGNGITLQNNSGNNAKVIYNQINTNGLDGYSAGIYSDVAANVNVFGNDMEGNFIVFDVAGMLNFNFHDNYIENISYPTATDIARFGAGNTAVNIYDNYFQDKQLLINGISGGRVEGNKFANCNLVDYGDNEDFKFGINKYSGTGTDPYPNSLENLVSTTKGFSVPKMTTTQRDAISTPAEGLLVYNLTTHKLNIYNGSSWVES